MDIFGDSSKASETSYSDLFGSEKKKEDIFANIPSRAKIVETCHVSAIDASTAFDCAYTSRQQLEQDFKNVAAENEKYTNDLIDIAQDMQREYTKIESMYKSLSDIVDKIQKAMEPKKTWFGKDVPIDVEAVHQLIDLAQDQSKKPFTIDVFLTSKIQDAFDKSNRCDVKISKIEQAFNHIVMHGAATNDDPLLNRIVTTRKMIELQNISTEKTLNMLKQSYDKIENFRQNTLISILISAQNKLTQGI
jgi:hypothetical protein